MCVCVEEEGLYSVHTEGRSGDNCAHVRRQQCVHGTEPESGELQKASSPGSAVQRTGSRAAGSCCTAEILSWLMFLLSVSALATVLCVQVNGRTESSVKTLKGVQKSK